MGLLELILGLVGLIGSLSMVWLSRLHKRLDSMDERIRMSLSRDEIKDMIEDKLEPVEVQTLEIKDDIQKLDKKLDKIIDKLIK